MAKVVVGVKIYLYGADGRRTLTPPIRSQGDRYKHEEFETYEQLSEKQKRAQRRIDAIRRKHNTQIKQIIK